MSDIVFVKDLNLYTCIGYTEPERAFPQKLLANFECSVKDFKKGLALEDTVCYDTVSTLFIDTANNNTWILLEDLALELALAAFTKFTSLKSIKIKLDKFIVPNPASTGIEIQRKGKILNFDRYQRQISLKEIGLSGQEKISKAKVIVIGAGGLGTPVLQYLVGAGVGKILLFDKDKVSLSNLQRQVFYTEKDIGKPKVEVIALRLKELNKDAEIETIKDNFGVSYCELVPNYDLIVDGSDNFGTRYLLNDISLVYKIPLVSASIFGFEGQISVFNYKGGSSLRCLYETPPSVLDRPACDLAGVLGASVGILGSIQALEVIKVILNREDVLSGKLLYVKLLSLEFKILQFDKNIEVIKNTRILPISVYEGYNMCSQELIDISYDEFKEMEKTSKIEILDVRTEEEREEFSIGGKHICIQELKERVRELDFSKDMLVYCKSGGRSARAIEFLKMNSYSGKLYNLKDGITPLKK